MRRGGLADSRLASSVLLFGDVLHLFDLAFQRRRERVRAVVLHFHEGFVLLALLFRRDLGEVGVDPVYEGNYTSLTSGYKMIFSM